MTSSNLINVSKKNDSRFLRVEGQRITRTVRFEAWKWNVAINVEKWLWVTLFEQKRMMVCHINLFRTFLTRTVRHQCLEDVLLNKWLIKWARDRTTWLTADGMIKSQSWIKSNWDPNPQTILSHYSNSRFSSRMSCDRFYNFHFFFNIDNFDFISKYNLWFPPWLCFEQTCNHTIIANSFRLGLSILLRDVVLQNQLF